MIDLKPIPWKLAGVWNSVAYKEDRPLKARNYIYASEIGQPYYDRYLKMQAVPYTNPPNERSRRKFLAGNLFEFVTKQILVTAGIFQHEEMKANDQPYPSGLEVHGRCDFVAGGYVEKEEALAHIELLFLPDYLKKIGHTLVEAFGDKNLEKIIMELKAVSTFAFERVLTIKRAHAHNGLQGYHYQRTTDIRSEVCYLCKDDMRMEQFALDPVEMEPLYENDILTMSNYYKKKKKPPLARTTSFDILEGKFKKNIFVEWSPYLQHYGFTSPEAFRQSVKYIDKWNRVMSRYALVETGQKTPGGKPIEITKDNQAVRTEIIKAGHKFDELLKVKISLGAIEEVENEQ